jgi:hypothetical protein
MPNDIKQELLKSPEKDLSPHKGSLWYKMLRSGLLVTLSIGLAVFSSTVLGRPSTYRASLDKRWDFPAEIDVLSVTLQELQQFLSNGTVTSVQLVQRYLVSIYPMPA